LPWPIIQKTVSLLCGRPKLQIGHKFGIVRSSVCLSVNRSVPHGLPERKENSVKTNIGVNVIKARLIGVSIISLKGKS